MKKVEEFMIDGNTKEGDCCPECEANWDGGDILEEFVRLKDEGHNYYSNLSDDELIEAAGDYGWTPENKKRFGNLIGMELSMDDPEHYDGVSYWACPECGVAWCRWTGERSERFVELVEERNRNINGIETEEGYINLQGFDIDEKDKKHI